MMIPDTQLSSEIRLLYFLFFMRKVFCCRRWFEVVLVGLMTLLGHHSHIHNIHTHTNTEYITIDDELNRNLLNAKLRVIKTKFLQTNISFMNIVGISGKLVFVSEKYLLIKFTTIL